ncbi:PREDICTED: AT-rich interactive domain-containing protein 1-like [Ipomoea nil]|uniref:AT-rich interactive domain-containing protein 1-like n=1 Tax=Ipomoea nil TaxID=35883 RepID=UPI000901ED60|nr:PREDICTED: AT-rich interactive domain-containing protein 1-like [Ipomoea nil]
MNTFKRIQETKQASRKNPVQTNWLDYIQDESLKTIVIPVGPRFQADLPEWIGPPNTGKEKEESKWLGTQLWPIKNDDTNEERMIGKGRPEFCHCGSPGSVECVRRHVGDERKKVESELGPAFREWRFDEMGEDVSNEWTPQEQRKFESIVKRNPPLSIGKSFLQAAMAAFPSHNRRSILSYYFNVHLPRRISKETRWSDHGEAAGTDDEEKSASSTNSRKTSCRKKRRFVY